MTDDRTLYRTVIDALVVQCRDGQGQISARRVRAGLWNENADAAASDGEQHAMNTLLAGLDETGREALAVVLEEEFASGVFNALQILEAARIAPFETGESGTASDNFLDRMDDWEWPSD